MTSRRRIVLFGECMIELHGSAFGTMRQTFGGDTLNTAVYLARLLRDTDIQVSYATALGTDPFSDRMVAAWGEEGIDTALVRLLDDRLPGLYAIQVDASGEREFFYWRDSSAVRSYFAVPDTPLEAAAASGLAGFYISGTSLAILPPEGRERLFAVAAQVRASSGLVAFDNNFRPRLWPSIADARIAFDRAYALSDILFVTLDDETALRGDMSDDRTLANVLEFDAREVVVKCGAQPTLIKVAGTPPVSVPVESVPRIVDTTAAGHSFAAAYLAMRLTGVPPAVAAGAANRLAGMVIQHPGEILLAASMPTRQELVSPERATSA